MLERTVRILLLLSMAGAPLTGCAYMTKNGRQQMAYQHYVRKMSGRRMKQQKKIKPPRIPATPAPSEDKVQTGVSESPQSVSSSQPPQSSEQPQSTSSNEPPNGDR